MSDKGENKEEFELPKDTDNAESSMKLVDGEEGQKDPAEEKGADDEKKSDADQDAQEQEQPGSDAEVNAEEKPEEDSKPGSDGQGSDK